MAGSTEGAGIQQRRAHERMTPEQFIWWLRGFLEAGSLAAHGAGKQDVAAVQAALDRVGPYAPQPPAPQPPAPAPTPSIFEKVSAGRRLRCLHCGQPTLGGISHFCNGALVNG